MIIIHSSDTRDRLVAVIGLGPLRRRNAVRFDEPPTAPSVRVFMGAAAIDRCRDVLAASASPLGLRPAHDDRSLCLLLHRGDMIAADSVCQIAARHAVISTVVEAASAKRMRLRWSDIGLLAARDREGVRPAEPYTIDLDSEEGEVAWHWLRVLFRREPTANDLHNVAILQECERVADAMERTSGMRREIVAPATAWSANLAREAALAASSILGRRPVLGEVIGPPAWDASAARRYLVRQMTGGT